MHRVYCQEFPEIGGIVELEAREKEHLFKVFRAAVGDEVGLLDGRGQIGCGVVVSGKMVKLTTSCTVPEPQGKLHLCCALPRRQKLDGLLKQATELGAWSIRPVRCERSVACGDPKERWELHFREACKQSGNPFIPQMHKELPLTQLLEELNAQNIEIYYGSVTPKVVEFTGRNSSEKALLIGPEGGFSDDELALIEAKGGKGINFAPHILRLETAAIAGLTVLRMLTVLLICGVAGLFAGCGQGDIEKNPLMVKAARLRDSGDLASSCRYYRQAIARYPENPEVYFALGKLCDEDLNDPYEALFCYRSFLQLAPDTDSRRADVEKLLKHQMRRIAEASSADIAGAAKLKAENEKLKQQNENLHNQLRDSKLYIARQEQRWRQMQSGKRRTKGGGR